MKKTLTHLVSMITIVLMLTACNNSNTNSDQNTIKTSKAGFSGYSNDTGYLEPLDIRTISPFKENLLAVYIVGSDLESKDYAATRDLLEMLEAYYNILSIEQQSNLDIVIAFGGADKDGWRGVKFANIDQINNDWLADEIFGNADSSEYLYTAENAHMGDENTLSLFLSYLNNSFEGHNQRYLMMWDHGASYGMFGNDENFGGDGLTLQEMKNGFNNIGIDKFDLLGYDACLNGSLEIANISKDHFKYLMGSEELEPGHGWNWEKVVTAIASSNDVVQNAKDIIDNYVQDVHIQYSTGKTLSIVDLSKFDQIKTSLDNIASIITTHFDDDPNIQQAMIQAADDVQSFGKNAEKNTRVSMDLVGFFYYFAQNLPDAYPKHIVFDQLIEPLKNEYILHSNTDGTRLGASGVSIAPIEGASNYTLDNAFSPTWYNLIQKYTSKTQEDTISPLILAQAFDILSDDLQFKSDNKIDISNLCKETEECDIQTTFEQNIQLRSRVQNNLKLPKEKMAFIQGDKLQRSLGSGVEGSLVHFSDSNLKSVKSLYGNIIDNTFLTVGAVEAYETTNDGEYFTPAWNQKWYTVQFDPDKETMWMPMELEDRYELNGEEYTIYSAEIDYYDSSKDYSEYTEQEGKFDYGRLEITVDSTNSVIHHFIKTYKWVYASEDDQIGYALFDKVTAKIKPGDKISFYAQAYDLNTNESFWNLEGDFDDPAITFTQEPIFQVEELAFTDENGLTLPYYFTMLAKDASDNAVLSDAAQVK